MHYLCEEDFGKYEESYVLKGAEKRGYLETPIFMGDELKGSNYQMTEEFSQYKLNNKENRGLNRCYCRLEESIIDLLHSS